MIQYYTIEEIEKIKENSKKCDELQNEYDFEIPKYILSQLIKPSYNKTNVAALINLAVMNDRFTSEDGRLLKNKYCKTN